MPLLILLSLKLIQKIGNRTHNIYFQLRLCLQQIILVREVILHKGHDMISGHQVESLVHGHFTKEILDTWVQHNKRPQSVPKIVEAEKAFLTPVFTLV
ncbi:hypothetical protein D9M68_876840 [compost metagenome]